MWASLRLIMFLTIFETVFDHVKCKGKIKAKTFVPVTTTTTTKPTVTHTHRHNNIIQWVSFNDTNEENNTITTGVPFTTTVPNHYHSENKTNSRTSEQKIVRIWEPAEPEEIINKLNTTTTFSTSMTRTTTSKYLKPDCKLFKVPEIRFDYNKMADIWQTVYYQLQDKVQCFKLYIKKISDDERKTHQEKYSSFDGKVNWDHIFLEIKAVTNIGRKHFLQGNNTDLGVMRNIIIAEENNSRLLQEESSDQWLVIQKLLLLRDCESGGIVVFSRVPHLPLQQDIVDALKQFGEEDINGSPACPDDETVNRYYETEEEGIENFK